MQDRVDDFLADLLRTLLEERQRGGKGEDVCVSVCVCVCGDGGASRARRPDSRAVFYHRALVCAGVMLTAFDYTRRPI